MSLVTMRMKKLNTTIMLIIKVMTKLLMTVAVTKKIIMNMIMMKTVNEMATLLLILNGEDVYDDTRSYSDDKEVAGDRATGVVL
jgi:hypothetical protein